MKPRRVFFVNRFYWPEEPATAQLLTDLASSLAEEGHPVTVVTSLPAAGHRPKREERDGVSIERVRTTRWGRHNLFGRACDFATFYPAALFRLLRLVRRGDMIVALTDPPLIGVVAWLASALRGAVLVHWAQDIYPEVAVHVTGHRWPLAVRPLRNFAWRRATACVVPGTDMAGTIAASRHAPPRVLVSPNWAPAGIAPPGVDEVAALRTSWGLTGKFVVAYSGNLGRVHDLTPLLETATALRDDPSIAIVFIGDGAQRPGLEREARARALTNVFFFPPQPRDHLAVTLGLGDVHFVSLRPGAERYVFPSKLYGIARVGRPVVLIAAPGSELAQLVRREQFGESFSREEIPRVAAFLRELQISPARMDSLRAAALRFEPRGLGAAANLWHQLISRELAGSAGLSVPSVRP